MRCFDRPEQQRGDPPTPGVSRARCSTTGPHGLELARKALRGLVSSFFIVHYVITFLYISFCARVLLSPAAAALLKEVAAELGPRELDLLLVAAEE